MKTSYHIFSIDQYNQLYGLKTKHPLVAIINLNETTDVINHIRLHYGIYALFLKEGYSRACEIKYGRHDYDYQQGSIVSFAPGQVIEINNHAEETIPKVIGLLFHPDFIRNTPLGQKIKSYRFFSYQSNEALHLSPEERETLLGCLDQIQYEIDHAIDHHSQTIIVNHIELFLNYCLRFYERQFNTRSQTNTATLQRFERYMDEYWESKPQELPSVSFFAEKMCLSPNYFGDLIKKETGRSPQDHIQYKLIEHAKDRIMGSEQSISEIAYELGFSYPQHFTRLFKKLTGITPKQYRQT